MDISLVCGTTFLFQMKRTVQHLREECGESRSDLAEARGVTLNEATAWEFDQAEPTNSRLRVLAAHFGVRDDQMALEPGSRHRSAITSRRCSEGTAAALSRSPGGTATGEPPPQYAPQS